MRSGAYKLYACPGPGYSVLPYYLPCLATCLALQPLLLALQPALLQMHRLTRVTTDKHPICRYIYLR